MHPKKPAGVTLVTGGAGYIGSHFLRQWKPERGRIVVFDNLENGHRAALPEGVEFVAGDLVRPGDVQHLFASYPIDTIVHFAGLAEVAESMEYPFDYYENNVLGGFHLIRAAAHHHVGRFVFSSTAATYGTPDAAKIPIPEDAPQQPVNAYGHSKLMVERMLLDCARQYGMHACILRYFNVAGAAPEQGIGEDHNPETHLIPNLLLSLQDKGGSFTLYGDDYPTPDGTCVRDYVHVLDLADVHWLALDGLRESARLIYNVGSQQGYSVRQVIEAVERVTGRKVQIKAAPRRPGDPPTLVADCRKIQRELKWRPGRGLDDMIASAWQWHSTFPSGYAARGGDGNPRRLFGELAVELGVAKPADVQRALHLQEKLKRENQPHKMIGILMLENGMLSTTGLIEILQEMDKRSKLAKV